MEIVLTDPQNRNLLFQRAILANVKYWQSWLRHKMADMAALDREYSNIVRAIAFAFDLDDAWVLVYKLIEVFSTYMERRGHWETWSRVLTQAVDVAQRRKDVANEVSLSVLLARLLFQQNKFKLSVHYYRRTIQLARQIGDRFNEARACTNLGFYYIEQGQWYRAEVLSRRALTIFEQIKSDHGRAHTENHLGFLYTRSHKWELAQQHLERACSIWQHMDDKHGLLRGYINLGALYNYQEKPNEALKYLEKALHLAQETGDEIIIGRVYINMGHAATVNKELVKAEEYTRQAEIIFQRNLDSMELARVWVNLGYLYFCQNKWSEALSYLEKSLETWRSLKYELGEVEVLVDLVECELARGRPVEARARLHELEQIVLNNYPHAHYQHLQVRLASFRHLIESQS